MVTFAEFATAVVDDVVSYALHEIFRSQRIPSKQRLLYRANKAFETGWRDSMNGDWQQDISLTNLRELYYEPDDIDDEIHAAWASRIAGAVSGFWELPLLKALCVLPSVDWKATDELVSFSIGEHSVWCRIDLAHRLPDGRLALIHWHLEPTPEEAVHPLQVAALYAEHVWHLPPERLLALSVLLDTSPQIDEISLDREVLGAVERRIQEESLLMQAGGDDADSFGLADDSQICTICNFPAICPRFEESQW